MIPKLSEIIRDSEGEVTKVENLGTQDVAYPQKNQMQSGVYLQFEISADPLMPDRLKEKLKLEKKIDRVLIECK